MCLPTYHICHLRISEGENNGVNIIISGKCFLALMLLLKYSCSLWCVTARLPGTIFPKEFAFSSLALLAFTGRRAPVTKFRYLSPLQDIP